MKNQKIAAFVLCLALMAGTATLVSLNSLSADAAVAAGDLSCDEVRGCKGGASCEFGSADDACILTCSDGTSVLCNFGEPTQN